MYAVRVDSLPHTDRKGHRNVQLDQSRLTFEQLTAEIQFNDREIVKAINAQAADVSSPQAAQAAQAIVDLYRKAETASKARLENEANAAIDELLGRYDAWRYQFAELTGPIAASLGHPLPDAFGERFPDDPSHADGGMFASAVAAAPVPTASIGKPPLAVTKHPVGTELIVEQPDVAQPPPAGEKPAQAASKRSRRAWSQSDIVALTLLFAKAEGKPDGANAAASTFIAKVRDDLEPGEVLGKAVELGLMEAPAVAAKPELSESDKALLTKRVRENISSANIEADRRVIELKFAMGALREFIKELAG